MRYKASPFWKRTETRPLGEWLVDLYDDQENCVLRIALNELINKPGVHEVVEALEVEANYHPDIDPVTERFLRERKRS